MVLSAALFLPSWAAAEDQQYHFTDLNVPSAEDSYYTEDLWEVTESGVYDNQGQKIDTSSSNATSTPSKPKLPSGNNNSTSSPPKLTTPTLGLTEAKNRLEDQQKRFEELSKQINQTQEILEPLRQQVTELQGQIDLLNQQIRLTKDKITNVEVMIAEKKIQIRASLQELKKSQLEVDLQKEVVLEYIKLLYQEESKFFDLYDKGSSSLKLLLSDQTVAENLAGEEYLAIMEQTGRDVFNELNQTRQDLAEKQVKILREQEDLEYLYDQLTQEKKSYEETRSAKNKLLEDTQGQEEKYAQLLEESLKQQQEAEQEVQNLQQNIQVVEEALKKAQNTAGVFKSPEKLGLTAEAMAWMNSGRSAALVEGKPLSWPVPPNKITAEFQDPSYPAKWGLHNAIDIRTPQNTPILAPADAYVSKVRDNGKGYSYIVLAHQNNLVTVYGHVSQILVEAGQTVKRGEVIGLSGGSPGTDGAGLQTTGAHLHFEVYEGGKAVDPLNYLPVSQLPAEYVPDKHVGEL